MIFEWRDIKIIMIINHKYIKELHIFLEKLIIKMMLISLWYSMMGNLNCRKKKKKKKKKNFIIFFFIKNLIKKISYKFF